MSVRALSEELLCKAVRDLNEKSERVEEDLKHIKEWGMRQPHMNLRLDDQWLVGMLRGNKFSLEKTKHNLDNLYALKSLLPEFFGNRDPLLPEIQEILSSGFLLPLQKVSEPAAPRVIVCRLDKSEPSKMKLEDLLKVALMINDVMILEDDNYVVAGMQLIIDTRGVTPAHVLQATPAIFKKFQTLMRNSYSPNIIGIYGLNVNSFAITTYSMIKSFLQRWITDLIHLYSNEEIKQLYDSVPLYMLPKDFGGQGLCCDDLTRVWKDKIENYRDWFLEDLVYRSDESKRPGKPKTTVDIFGTEGTFRKLEVD